MDWKNPKIGDKFCDIDNRIFMLKKIYRRIGIVYYQFCCMEDDNYYYSVGDYELDDVYKYKGWKDLPPVLQLLED